MTAWFPNHWSFYLEAMEINDFDQSERSGPVRLDMIPTDAFDGTGMLVISKLPYELTVGVVKYHKMSAPPGLLFPESIERLTTGGRHRYRFATTGLGCRYWTFQCTRDLDCWFHDLSQVTESMVRKTWLPQGQEAEAEASSDWTVGTFY